MKKILATLGLAAVISFAGESVQGQLKTNSGFVKWTNSVTGLTSTRIKIVSGGVSADTSTAFPKGGAWKVISTGADSCSQPFWISSDTMGTLSPIWQSFLLEGVVKAATPSTSTHVYRIQTRNAALEVRGDRIKRYWRPWTLTGRNVGDGNVAVVDSITFTSLNAAANTKYAQYGQANVYGTQARICPDNNSTTGSGAGDSVIIDSLMYISR
jgi:hypothetical protein